MTALLKKINRVRKSPARLFVLAKADYLCSGKHLTAIHGRIVHKKG